MDKIIITVFLSSLIGLVTAALSIVKLVNEKENKTTEYRQAWTDSLRKTLAELISNLNTQASYLVTSYKTGNNYALLLSADQDEDSDQNPENHLKDYFSERIQKEQQAVREMRKAIHHSYALTRLHFKPNDTSFARIENKFDIVMNLLDSIQKLKNKEDEKDREIIKEKIHAEVAEITAFSRDILKTEWESVKKGEKAYQTTKTWSIFSGLFLFFIIISIGIHAFINSDKEKNTTNQEKYNSQNLSFQNNNQPTALTQDSTKPHNEPTTITSQSFTTTVECNSERITPHRSPINKPNNPPVCK